jgi:F-type H+-transporting ATPase subunit epsilon
VPLHLEIVTPKGPVIATDVDEVNLPGKLGEFGVMEGHIPFLSALKPGVVSFGSGGQRKRIAIGTGFAEVGAHNKVLVLTDSHALPSEIETTDVQKELEDIERELKAWSGEITVEHQDFVDKAAWAQARIDSKAEPK